MASKALYNQAQPVFLSSHCRTLNPTYILGTQPFHHFENYHPFHTRHLRISSKGGGEGREEGKMCVLCPLNLCSYCFLSSMPFPALSVCSSAECCSLVTSGKILNLQRILCSYLWILCVEVSNNPYDTEFIAVYLPASLLKSALKCRQSFSPLYNHYLTSV